MPCDNFVLLRKEKNSVKFRYIAEQLKNLNLQFFEEQSEIYKTGFIFEVSLNYCEDSSMGNR